MDTSKIFSLSQSTRILIKGAFTGILILVMMIPTIMIMELVRERKLRQQEVVAEVASKWSSAQTVSGPFLFIPYSYIVTDAEGKSERRLDHFFLLPDQLNLSGNIDHEIRKRSIFKVLLYRSAMSADGQFKLQLPEGVLPEQVIWQDAKLCIGLSDFRGIEEKLVVKFAGRSLELTPGLPAKEVTETGLSVPAGLTAADLGKEFPFTTTLKLKGSESLHFLPLSGNSSFSLKSNWPAPSFDGNTLPSTRSVSESGFSATWVFNRANLPFGSILRSEKFDLSSLAFGVTMVQPADHYTKTDRAAKYAILVIGLTFSLFFIVELLQKKPVHPVQYLLVGLALVIFYTLLLSISEYLDFDLAYFIASAATIALVLMYIRSHFGNWRATGAFAGMLVFIYGFVFVLVRLEDTALLVGSIGLFFILALAMYASRKIRWYGE